MGRTPSEVDKKKFENIMTTCGAFFTADQVADCCDVSRTTLYRWIKREYPKENFETLRNMFSSRAKFQINAYCWKAMANGNGRLIERSMEEAGIWQKRDKQTVDMNVTNEPEVVLNWGDNGRGGYEPRANSN